MEYSFGVEAIPYASLREISLGAYSTPSILIVHAYLQGTSEVVR